MPAKVWLLISTLLAPPTLRSRLILLVLATMLPLLIFAIAMIVRLENEERAVFERGATERTRALLTAVDSELRRSIGTLEALATSSHFDTGNLHAFYDEAARVIKTQPGWLTIMVVSPTGQQLVNLQRPFGNDLPTTVERESFDQLLRTGKPTVGNVSEGPIVRQYAFTVRVPVIRNGAIKYVLTAVVDPQSISQLLLAQKLPPDWIGAVLDVNGRLVARTIEPERNVGQLGAPTLRAALDRAPEGWFRGTTREGWDVYTPYNRSNFSGWTVAIGIPAAAVDASLRRSLYYVTSFGLILLISGIALAWFLSSRTAKAIESLSRMTEDLGLGKGAGVTGTPTDVPNHIVEVESVKQALLTASRLIQDHSRERDRVEAALREASEWLELAQESAGIGVFEGNLVTNEIKWSVSQEKLYGISPGSFAGEHEDWARRVHPDDLAAAQAAIRRSAERLTPYSAEFRIIRPDGTVRWIASQARIFPDVTGKPCRMIGVNVDITPRKQAQEKLAEALRQQQALYRFVERRFSAESLQELYHAALDAILSALRCERAAILLLDESGLMRFVAWRGLSDRYRKAAEGHSPWKQDGPNPAPICIPDVAATGLAQSLKVVVAAEDIGALAFIPLVLNGKLAGKFMTYYDAPHVFDDEELELSLTIARQLALGIERKYGEEKLRESERRLELALSAGQMGAWQWNIRTGQVIWSPGLEEIHGLRPGTFGGRFEDFKREIHPDDLPTVLARIQETLETHRGYHAEYRFTRPDGASRWLEAFGRIWLDDDGEPQNMVGVCMDITARKQAEEALREADRRKDEFLAMLGHELRNPLGVINTVVQLMRIDGPPHPKLGEFRDTIDLEVKQMSRLLDDLLDISRIARGLIRLKKEPCDFAAIVRQAVENHRPLLEENGLRFALYIPDDSSWVLGDWTRLAQIVGNLLHNANKFTDRGGWVTVRLTEEREASAVLLSVRDTGIGMEPEILSRVFEPFVQADKSLHRTSGGLGLGLALVKALVELQGGAVGAWSEGPGRGSEFTVRLPLAKAPSPVRLEEPRAGATRSRRVLIIEDNLPAAQSLQSFLGRRGHVVEVALSGTDGIEAALRFQPEIVLCDIGLPGLDGYAVARALRQEAKLKGMYLVAVSGYGQQGDHQRGLEAGFDRYLNKPIDLAKLEILIGSPIVQEPASGT